MAITLDVTTLSVMSVIMFGILTLLAWMLWHGHREEPATLFWAAGLTLASLGLCLLVLRGRIPDLLSIAGSNYLLLLCSCLCWWGTDRFFERRPRYAFGLTLATTLAALIVYFSVLHNAIGMRILIMSAGLTVLSLAHAFAITRSARQQMRLPQMLAATAFVVLAALNMARFHAALKAPASATLFDDVALNALNFLLPPICCCFALFGWTLMVTQKLRLRLAETVRRDGLTGILNRAALDETAAQEMSRCQRHHKALSMLMLDIDLFKQINDRHGHKAGDLVLLQVVQNVRRHLRREDHFGRYGGDEFIVLLPETPAEGARLLAERVRRAIAGRKVELPGDSLTVTASIGVASTDIDGDLDWDRLTIRADAALYEAKRRGRNRVVNAAGDAGLTLSGSL